MMIVLPTYEGETAVLGLGVSGRSVIAALCRSGNMVVGWDDDPVVREDIRRDYGIPIRDLASDFGFPSRLVVSPGILPMHTAVVRAGLVGVSILCDIALFADARRVMTADVKVIAITGTNGKSTTASLLAHILEVAGFSVALGGNIGVPVLMLPMPSSAIESGGSLKMVYVLELSSYQLMRMGTFVADISVLTNITPDHIAWHGSYSDYCAAKARLFDVGSSDVTHSIIGVDTTDSALLAARYGAVKVSGAGATSGADYYYDADALCLHSDGGVRTSGEARVIDLRDTTRLEGVHNGQNAACAFAVADYLALGSEVITTAMVRFEGLAHRMEQVAHYDSIRFIDDSKATNIAATVSALVSFDNIYWIAGGQSKGEDVELLADSLSHVRAAYLIGQAAVEFAQVLKDYIRCEICLDMRDAVYRAASAASESGDDAVVLLAPVAASFDSYRNFEVRGDDFTAMVSAWRADDIGSEAVR